MTFAPQVICAVPTPFTDDGEVDLVAFESLLGSLEGYVDSVFVAGTTGEFPALTDDERAALFRAAVQRLGAEHVIAHVGAHSVPSTYRLLADGREAGITRFAAITPMYFAVDDARTVEYFLDLGERLNGAGMYAYLFPERTGNTTSSGALAEIVRAQGVRGVKLSGKANLHLDQLLDVPGGPVTEVYTGDDGRLPEVAERGAAGVISGCCAAFPQAFGELRNAVVEGDADAVAAAQAGVSDALELVGPSVRWLKEYLAVATGHPWKSRMPMTATPAARSEQIRRAVQHRAAR